MSRPAEPREPTSGETARLVVSFLIFLHLFAVLVASLASARRVSGAVDTLYDRLVGPYAQFLNIGQYNLYHLTYALDSDLDHNCDVLVNWRPGIDDSVEDPQGLTRLPLYGDSHAFPRHRQQRYQMLARMVDVAATSGESSGLLVPLSVTRTLLAENEITAGEHRFRCRVKNAPRPPWPEVPPPSPPSRNVYGANIVFQSGLAQLVEDAPEAQVAPVDRQRSDRTLQPRLKVPSATTPPKTNQNGDRK
jgi:hypothetical protein